MQTWQTFLLVLFLHVFADFNMQIGGTLHNLKSKDWWVGITAKSVWGSANEQYRKYKYDYLVGLIAHASEWTFVTFLPILWNTSALLAMSIYFPNVAVHAYIDHLKANRYKINLWQDQLLHLAQIILTFGVWMIWR